MTRTVTRGLIAGAAGTTVLDVLGYLDMAVRGRPASTLPARTLDALGDRLGVTGSVPADVRESRHAAMGAIGGIGVGLAVGVLASALRRWGLRPGPAVGSAGLALAAMAATDLPAAALGVSDPRTWSTADWLSDVVPHLGYGVAVDAVLRGDPGPEQRYAAGPARPALVLRCALLGVAAGSRSSLGVAGPALTSPPDTGPQPLLRRRQHALRRVPKALAVSAVAGELVADKLPQTPSRLQPPVLGFRLVSGATGAVALARRCGARPAAPVMAGVMGAAAGSFGGFAWRAWADRRVPDWQAALVEDAVAALLALVATVPGGGAAPVQVRVPSRHGRESGGRRRGGESGGRRHGGESGGGRRARGGDGTDAGPAAGVQEPGRFRSSPGTFPGLRAYRPSGRRGRRRTG